MDIESTDKVDQNQLKYISWTLRCRFWPNILILAFHRPKMKVHRSSEVREHTYIKIKGTRDIESTSKVDQNYLKYISCTWSRRFWSNILILLFLGPKMKVHRSSEVPVCTEINKKEIRDIESIRKVDHNHLKCISWIVGRSFRPNILILAFLGPKMKVYRPKLAWNCRKRKR